jgi:hypothetical protein
MLMLTLIVSQFSLDNILVQKRWIATRTAARIFLYTFPHYFGTLTARISPNTFKPRLPLP